MASKPDLIAFASPEAMAERLASLVSLALEQGIHAQGLATIALSGGTTPEALYRRLSAMNVDWANVAAAPVDERWVAPAHPASNEGFIRRAFLKERASAARFVGLWSAAPSVEAAASEANDRVAGLVRPFEAVILGMGADGHTASWFPRAQGLAAALDDRATSVVAVRATKSAVTGDHLERLTLSLRAIRDARLVILMMTGDEKRRAFERACGEGAVEDMPVRAILRA
ncbi:MAG: 6-phosphogluconolactonase, partial [Pseudomonadota bacterium]